MAWQHTYGLPVTLSNCSNNYGPYQFPEKLIPLMILNMLEEKPLPVYGDGKNIRDWIYVEDHSRAVYAVMRSGAIGERYNIGGENEWENIRLLQTLIDIVAKKTGRDAEKIRSLITYVKDRPGHDRRYAIDCEKIKRGLGWRAAMSFNEGLSQTVEWYLAHKDWTDNIRNSGYKRWLNPQALASEPIEELERLYKLGHEATPDGSAELDEARRELLKLQNGDPENTALWQQFSSISLNAFQKIYDRLGIRFDLALGESFYNDKTPAVCAELEKLNIATQSDGALVVFHPEHPRFKTQPFIIRKTDGASNYATTDLATALYRAEQLHADGIAIVTDFRQSDHFEQLFLTLRKWFAATGRRLPALNHVSFGAVTGPDGKALKTRDGGTIKLRDLLDEAVARALKLVTEKNPDLPEAERRLVAEAVGVGAVQYADLSQNRSSNYVFSWDKMLAFEGNTAPYLLYAVARIRSIVRKLNLTPGAPASETGASPLQSPAELALARKLVRFPDALALATDSLRPHYLCLYLFELAGEFSAFYAAEKVAVDAPDVRARRLMLCARTLLILETGLHLLSLRTVERM
jgi:arginyl-tRNA synthetase